MSKYDIIFAMPDKSMVQVEEEMFVTFVTWMVHDFCHDIDNSKSNGSFYNLFQENNAKNRLFKVSKHIVQNGGNPKNLSFQEDIDINCKSANRIQYIPNNVPDNREEFKIKFNEIYGIDETGKDNILEAYQIIFNVLRDIIEDINGMIVSGEITDPSIMDSFEMHIIKINQMLKKNYEIPMDFDYDILSENIINSINAFNNEIESGNSVIKSQVSHGLNIIINTIYDLYNPETVLKVLIFKYLSIILNPQEYFVKDYIENNYNFKDKSYMDPDIIKNMALDYLACPYRFRIFIEIIDKLSTGVFRELYLKVSKFFSEKFNAYMVDTASWTQVKKINPGISEEFLINTFYEMIKVITDNFLTEFSGDKLEAELLILFDYIYKNGYFSKENIENGGISLIKEAYEVIHSHDFLYPAVEYDPGLEGGSYPHQNGGWNDNPTAYTQFNTILVNLKNLLGGYNQGGKYNIGNFDDTILDSIINPNDNLPYSDFVNDSENPENIQRALDKVLPEGISKVTISKKLDDFKENKKEFENNGKAMICYINRTPPRIKLTDPFFLYTKDFDGLIFLEVYEIVWFIAKSAQEGAPIPHAPVYDNPLINYIIGRITRLGSKGLQSIENIKNNLQSFASQIDPNQDPRTVKNLIESAININKLKIDLIEKQTEFLKYQKPYYMGKGNLTPQQKNQKKQLINNVINSYRDILAQLQVTNNTQNISPLQNEINRIFYYSETFNKDRPEGGTLDSQMWNDHINPGVGGRTVSSDNFANTPEIQSISEYLNNAISRKFLDILGKNKNVICFASLIDPMSTFGDCSFLNDIKDKNGTIYIYFGVDDNNYFKIDLKVTPNNNVTVEGDVELNILGMEMINVHINESNFNKKTPFSIANTVAGFKNNPDNDRNQAVKKFLGDYLQGMEAISKGYIYYSGDKPATAMYDYMNKTFTNYIDYMNKTYPNFFPNNSYGGFVDPSNGSISGQSIPATTVQGGGKKKKRTRKKRKHISHKRKMINELKKFNKSLKKSLKKSRKKRKSKKKKSLTSR